MMRKQKKNWNIAVKSLVSIMCICLLYGCYSLPSNEDWITDTDDYSYVDDFSSEEDISIGKSIFEDYHLIDYAVICEIIRNELFEDGYDEGQILGCEVIDIDEDGDEEMCVNMLNGDYGYTFYVIKNYEQPSISISSYSGSTLYEYFVSESQQKIFTKWTGMEFDGYNVWMNDTWQPGEEYIESVDDLELRDLYFDFYEIAEPIVEADETSLLAGLEEHFIQLGCSVQKGNADVDGNGTVETVYQIYDYMELWLESINNLESMGVEVFAARNNTNDDIYLVVEPLADGYFNIYATHEEINMTSGESIELGDGSLEETNNPESFIQDMLIGSNFYNPSLFDVTYKEYIFDEGGIVTINNVMYDGDGVTEIIETKISEYVVDEAEQTVTFEGSTFYYIEKYGCFRASKEYDLDQDYRAEWEYYENTHPSCLIPMGENPDVQELQARFEEANGF